MAENTNNPSNTPAPSNPNDPNDPRNQPQPGKDAKEAKAEQPQDAAKTPPKKKKRRLWLKIPLALIVLLVVLVAFAPMILSTGAARSLAVGQANKFLNGHIQIDDWSFGWTGPIELKGVRIFDDQNREILGLARFYTPLSPIAAARGNIDLGETTIDDLSFDARIDKNGQLNFADLVKKSGTITTPKTTPPGTGGSSETTVPNVRGTFKITKLWGTVDCEGMPSVHLDPSKITVAIPDINQPIKPDVDLAFRVGDAKTPGHITLTGEVDAIENNKVVVLKDGKFVPDKLVANQTLKLSDVDLAALSPFLRDAKVALSGIANGQLDLKAKGLKDASVVGAIKVDKLSAEGEALKGDKFQTTVLNVPISVAVQAVDPQTTKIKIETLKVEMDQAKVAIDMDTTLESLQSVVGQYLPGVEGPTQMHGTGTLNVQADANLAAIASQLPHLVARQQGVNLTSGSAASATAVNWKDDALTLNSKTEIKDVAGTNNGRPVALDPITVTATGSQKAGQPQDLTADVAGGAGDKRYITVNAKAQSLAAAAVNGEVNLAEAKRQAEQFVDLKTLLKAPRPVVLDGRLTFQAETHVADKGKDISDPTAPLTATATVNFANVKVGGIVAQGDFQQEAMQIKADGVLQRSGTALRGVQGASVAVTSGAPNRPLLDVLAKADVQLGTEAKPALAATFNLDHLIVSDLAQVQKDFAAFIPPQWLLRAGQIAVQAGGSYDGNKIELSQPLSVKASNLTVAMLVPEPPTASGGRPTSRPANLLNNETIDVAVQGNVDLSDGIAANLSALNVTTSSNLINIKKGDKPLVFRQDAKGMSGDGSVQFNGDLLRVNSLAEAFTGKPLVVGGPDNKLTSGQFAGQAAFNTTTDAAGKGSTGVSTAVRISNLTIGQAIQNKIIDVTASGASPDNFASVQKATVDVKSDGLIALAVRDGQLRLSVPDGQQTKPISDWDLVQSASVELSMPNLPQLQALIEALVPPAPAQPVLPQASAGPTQLPPLQAAPLPPLKVISGTGSVALTVKRDNGVTTVDVSKLRLDMPAFQRGDSTFNTNEVNFGLTAEVDTTGGNPNTFLWDLSASLIRQIREIRVKKLEGNVGTAEATVTALRMPKQITIKDLSASIPSVDGSIQATGNLDRVARLIEALQAKKAGAIPVQGQYDLTEAFAPWPNQAKSNDIDAKGTITLNKLRIVGTDAEGKQRVVSEDQVQIANNVTVDPKNEIANIGGLTVAMKTTNALAVDVTGKVSQWSTQRKVENVKMLLSYDLAQLWAMVSPLLDAKTLEPIKDLNIAGKLNKQQFLVNGSYPANLPMNQAIKNLTFTGGFLVQTAELPSKGIAVQNIEQPLELKNGVFALTKPKQQGVLNKGQLNLGGISVDLGQEHMRLTMASNQILLKSVELNPLFAKSFLNQYLNNPLFADKASGLLDVTIVECNRLPLDDYMNSPQSDGTLQMKYSVAKLNMGLGPLLEIAKFLKPNMLNEGNVNGSIKDGSVTIQKGVVHHETPVAVDKYVMSLSGNVYLADSSFRPMTLTLPAGFFGAEKYLTDITVALKGTPQKWKLDADVIVQKLAEAAVKAQAERFIPGAGGTKGGSKSGSDAQPKKEDPVGGLIDLFGKEKKKK